MTIPYPILKTRGADSAIHAKCSQERSSMVVSDAKTLQLIEEFESNFYGAVKQSCDHSFRRSKVNSSTETLTAIF